MAPSVEQRLAEFPADPESMLSPTIAPPAAAAITDVMSSPWRVPA
jgi:hypothetical protein